MRLYRLGGTLCFTLKPITNQFLFANKARLAKKLVECDSEMRETRSTSIPPRSWPYPAICYTLLVLPSAFVHAATHFDGLRCHPDLAPRPEPGAGCSHLLRPPHTIARFARISTMTAIRCRSGWAYVRCCRAHFSRCRRRSIGHAKQTTIITERPQPAT